MKVTVFTGNQPRHIALIERMASIADEVYAVIESNTVLPGKVADFYARSAVMQRYFERVLAAEKEVFGAPRFLPRNTRALVLKSEDVNLLPAELFLDALQSDVFIVFGACYIKGSLCDALVERRALNIHMGVSPQYRGSSCNFWALYDRHPELVGATIHLLSKGLDSGPMLFHALPRAEAVDGFVLGMQAVKAAHDGLLDAMMKGKIVRLQPIPQDKARQIRYTRNAAFTDAVAEEYLNRLASPPEILAALNRRNLAEFVAPFVAGSVA